MKNMILKSALVFTVVSTVININAQQDYQFANSAFNPYLLNPAAGGMTDVMQFEITSRSQWLGYDGGPRTFLASGNSQFAFKKGEKNVMGEFNVKDEKLFEGPKVTIAKKKHVVGGKIWNDNIGPFSKTSFQGSYAYHLPLSKKLNFGVGIGLGMSNFSLDQNKVNLYQTDDNTYNQFLGNSSQQNLGDAQAGFVVYGEKFYFGFSSSQILKNSVVLNSIMTGSNFNRHYFTMMKYKFALTKTLNLEPSLIVKSVSNSPLSLDFGARIITKNRSWASIQYRSGNSLIFQVGSNLLKNLYICYAYEQSTGKLRVASNGTHEIQLGFYLGKNRNMEDELKDGKKKEEKAQENKQ